MGRGPAIPIEFKRLLRDNNSVNELYDAIGREFPAFAKENGPSGVFVRAVSLWKNRRVYLQEIADKDHTVMIPAKIHKKGPDTDISSTSSSLPDIGEILSRQNNLLAEQNQLLKEIVKIGTDIKIGIDALNATRS